MRFALHLSSGESAAILCSAPHRSSVQRTPLGRPRWHGLFDSAAEKQRRTGRGRQALETRVSDEATTRCADNERIEGSVKCIEERLKKLEVKERTQDESGAESKPKGVRGEKGGEWKPRRIIPRIAVEREACERLL